MKFPIPLRRGHLIQRYKRFLADIDLESGERITASCPNTGAMLGLSAPGTMVWVSEHDSSTRKYRHCWELSESDLGGDIELVGINTAHPNKLVTEAIGAGRIAELAGYPSLRNEVKYGEASRIDILLGGDARGLCYVEVKNVHLMRAKGRAEFPDSVTTRGAKHLRELAAMVAAGHRAAMMFLIQRGDAETFSLARDIDPNYGFAFDMARAAGVEMLAYRCAISPDGISVANPVEVIG
jgi:sugar fermentation stimulation protein A